MKKIFSYIVGLVLVLSSAVGVTKLLSVSHSTNDAEASVSYVDMPAECFNYTKYFYKNSTDSYELKTAKEEGVVSSSNLDGSSQTYAIVGMKSVDYQFTYNNQTTTIGEFLSAHPYINLPRSIYKNGNLVAYVVGVSYFAEIGQVMPLMNGYSGNSAESNIWKLFVNNGAFDLSYYYKLYDGVDYLFDDGEIQQLTESSTDKSVQVLSAKKLIKGVFIPNTYLYIADSSFRFSNIEEVVFANNEVGSKYFGSGVFNYCLKLNSTYVQNSENSFPSNLKNGYVPANMYSNTAISSVTIPAKFTKINSGAFANCPQLQTVKFGTNSALTTIGEDVFANCIKLNDITLPSGVTVINNNAFLNDASLGELHIPSAVKTIGKHAFSFVEDDYVDYYEGNDIEITFRDIDDYMTIDNPRRIVFDGDRQNNSTSELNFYDFFYDDYYESCSAKTQSYFYYNAINDQDNFNDYLTTAFTNSDYAFKYFDKNSFKVSFKLSYNDKYSYINEEDEAFVYAIPTEQNETLFELGGIVGSDTYVFGSNLLIKNNGFSRLTFNDGKIDLIYYDFVGYDIELYNDLDNTEPLKFDFDKYIVTNQTKVYTDCVITARYKLQTFTVRVTGTNGNTFEDIPYGINLDEIYDYDEWGDKFYLKDEYFFNGDLDADDLNFVGIYSDSAYTRPVDNSLVVEGDITLYKRSMPIDQYLTLTLNADGNGYTISGRKSNSDYIQRLYIPATYKGKPITAIAPQVFAGHSTLVSLYFDDFDKDSTFTIGSYAFQGCSKLSYAELPSCNFNVADYAFTNSALTKIYLLGSVLSGTTTDNINGRVISSKALPNGCQVSISCKDSFLISDTNSLSGLNLVADAEDIAVFFEIGDKTSKYTLFPHHNLHLPSNDEKPQQGYLLVSYNMKINGNLVSEDVGDGTYSYTIFSKVIDECIENGDLPSGTTAKCATINFEANYLCKFDIVSNTVNGWSDEYKDLDYLTETEKYSVVDLPSTVTAVGVGAFKVGEDDDNTNINAYIKTVILPYSFSKFSDQAFMGCTNLSNIQYADNFTKSISIGQYAFKGCTALKSFGIISNDNYVKVASLDDGAFEGCTALATIKFSNASTLTLIGPYAFKDSGITEILIPDSVTLIADYAFENTKSLNKVVFTENSKIEAINLYAFSDSSISNINLEITNFESIQDYAFQNTKNLTSISLYSNASSVILHDNILQGSAVKTLYIDSKTYFGNNGGYYIYDSLYDATNLEKVVIVDSATSTTYANYNNDGIVYKLTHSGETTRTIMFIPRAYTGKLVIPSSVIDIVDVFDVTEDEPFKELRKVTSVEYENDQLDVLLGLNYIIADGALYSISGATNSSSSGTLSSSNNALTAVPVGRNFDNAKAKLVFVPNYSLPNFAFTIKANITHPTTLDEIPVTSVYKNALNSNTSIKAVYFEENNNSTKYTTVPNLCSDSIVAISIPKHITTITSSNFVDLKNLKTIYIEDSYVERGNLLEFASADPTTAFAYSDNLPTFVVPVNDVATYTSATGYNNFAVSDTVTIKFVTNGGANIADITTNFGANIAVPDANKIGYDFIGWYTDEALTMEYDNSPAYANITLYAKYNIHMYTYIYKVGDEVYFTQEVPYNTAPSGPESNPTKKGKIFVGWQTEDGMDYSLSSLAVTDMTLVAVFKTDTKYIAKIAIIGVVALVLFIVLITLIAKKVRKKKNK